jgi:putative hydrolase of the HAD superfamily
MLLLLDLDNTLIDRTAAFARWAARYVPAQGGGQSDVSWLIEADRDGYEPRERLAARIRERLGPATDVGEVLQELRAGMVAQVVFDPAVGAALTEAVAAGWVPVVVTNGSVRQQEAKLRHTGLDRLVAGWVVSEAAGVRKPDPRIFALGAQAAGRTLAAGGWMIGDHAEYDVGGATAAGLQTVWLRRGRDWATDLPYRPTCAADDCAAAIRGLVASAGERNRT